MKIGLIGTGAIAHKHAQAYKSIGFEIVAVNDNKAERGQAFCDQWGGTYYPAYQDVCRHPQVDIVDVCTFPDFRLQPLKVAADAGKHVQVQKPIAIHTDTAQGMIDYCRRANVRLGVVSQNRYNDSILFLKRSIEAGRLGKIFQADAYVKWFRSQEYYSRPIKGSWSTEGGGSLINQAIHQVDMLHFLIGEVQQLFAYWHLGAVHQIESDDVVAATLRYANGATGVLQASTAMYPGFSERIEIHGSKGSAILTGDKITTWEVKDDQAANAADPAPIASTVSSGASDPMAISLAPFERQFLAFGEAIRNNTPFLNSGEEGLKALALVQAIYTSCRENRIINLGSANA